MQSLTSQRRGESLKCSKKVDRARKRRKSFKRSLHVLLARRSSDRLVMHDTTRLIYIPSQL